MEIRTNHNQKEANSESSAPAKVTYLPFKEDGRMGLSN
jgi:hypothetical protein